MIKFVLNRGLSRPLFYSRVPAMEHLHKCDKLVTMEYSIPTKVLRRKEEKMQ